MGAAIASRKASWLARSKPGDREQRVVEARQPALHEQRDKAGDGGGENADGEGKQHEGRPGIERPAAAVDRVVDDGAVAFGAVGERRGADAAEEHGDAHVVDDARSGFRQPFHREGREGIERVVTGLARPARAP